MSVTAFAFVTGFSPATFLKITHCLTIRRLGAKIAFDDKG
jgi:hypothetical protein